MNIHVAFQRNAWTAEQQTTALQMRAEGAGNGQIARVVGKTRGAVRHWFINREKAKEPKARKPTYWDHGDRAERAIAMWKEGYSGTQIADKLRGGITRSAVIAWLNRHGHQRGYQEKIRTQTAKAPKTRKAPALRKPANVPNVPQFRAEAIPEPVVIGEPLNLTLDQIGHGQCKYICDGAGAESLYCGHPVHKGGSWCAGHHRVVFWQNAPVMKPSKHNWWGQ